mmetsp:Transcript_32301/g.69137  ORF Transcript_32301/g.69137 Transcript_32301/m.69137 type:complete len:391 (+) Transcript_32301:3-1175(+)
MAVAGAPPRDSSKTDRKVLKKRSPPALDTNALLASPLEAAAKSHRPESIVQERRARLVDALVTVQCELSGLKEVLPGFGSSVAVAAAAAATTAPSNSPKKNKLGLEVPSGSATSLVLTNPLRVQWVPGELSKLQASLDNLQQAVVTGLGDLQDFREKLSSLCMPPSRASAEELPGKWEARAGKNKPAAKSEVSATKTVDPAHLAGPAAASKVWQTYSHSSSWHPGPVPAQGPEQGAGLLEQQTQHPPAGPGPAGMPLPQGLSPEHRLPPLPTLSTLHQQHQLPLQLPPFDPPSLDTRWTAAMSPLAPFRSGGAAPVPPPVPLVPVGIPGQSVATDDEAAERARLLASELNANSKSGAVDLPPLRAEGPPQRQGRWKHIPPLPPDHVPHVY